MNREIAVFAGGCFWCTEAIFQRINGVIKVQSGYTGGIKDNPTYEEVSTGKTGHAEAIEITFDPSIISYERLLKIFWHLHNPTTLNQQGADRGTEYRSAIFYTNDIQKEKALKSKQDIEEEKLYKDPIVTEIVALDKFYPAEEYHDNAYDKNIYPMYCRLVIDPKINKLIKEFNNDLKQEYK